MAKNENSSSNQRGRGERSRTEGSFINTIRDRPYAGAAIVGGVAAAGAFLWSRRSQISEAVSSGMEQLNEYQAQRADAGRSQSEIAEEALSLKQTGDSVDQTSKTQLKAGAVSY